jgi:hypothetical protein
MPGRWIASITIRPEFLSRPGKSTSNASRIRTAINIALFDFNEHDEDPTFLQRAVRQGEPAQGVHLATKGWMFYNRALDDFFHGRVPPM